MKRNALLVAIVGSMAVAFGGGVWAQAAGQRAGQHLVAPTFQPGQPMGPVITGADIGFQATATAPARDGFIVGKILVRVNGRWLEVQSPVGVTAAR